MALLGEGRWRTVAICATLGAAAGWAAWRHQYRLLYMPRLPGVPATPRASVPPYRSPADLGLSFYDVRVPDGLGNSIHAWVMPWHEPGAPTVVFFHGNALHMGFRLPNVADLMKSARCSVVMMDYCGYGESTGEATDDDVVLAGAQAVLDHVGASSVVNGQRVVLYGRSLGGAVAAQLAHRNPGKVRAAAASEGCRLGTGAETRGVCQLAGVVCVTR